ncbi:hypothetical protein U9890_25095, partial [Escherichia coli]
LFLMFFCCGFRTVRFGARALAWEVLLDSERRGLGRCKRRPLCICSLIGIKTPKRLKKHHKTDVSSTPLLLHMNGTDD